MLTHKKIKGGDKTNKQKTIKGLTFIVGIIFLIVGILLIFVSAIGIDANLSTDSSVIPTLLLLLFLGLTLSGVGIGLLGYYLKKSG